MLPRMIVTVISKPTRRKMLVRMSFWRRLILVFQTMTTGKQITGLQGLDQLSNS